MTVTFAVDLNQQQVTITLFYKRKIQLETVTDAEVQSIDFTIFIYFVQIKTITYIQSDFVELINMLNISRDDFESASLVKPTIDKEMELVKKITYKHV